MKKQPNNVVSIGTAAPDHLSPDARRWWRKLVEQYDIGADDYSFIMLLQVAMEAHDRMMRCKAQIDAEGETVKDRFRQLRPHPALAAERDARAALLNAFKMLRLDIPLPE